MENILRAQLSIIKAMELKPNFLELARKYGIDRRTVKNIMMDMKESQSLGINQVNWTSIKMK